MESATARSSHRRRTCLTFTAASAAGCGTGLQNTATDSGGAAAAPAPALPPAAPAVPAAGSPSDSTTTSIASGAPLPPPSVLLSTPPLAPATAAAASAAAAAGAAADPVSSASASATPGATSRSTTASTVQPWEAARGTPRGFGVSHTRRRLPWPPLPSRRQTRRRTCCWHQFRKRWNDGGRSRARHWMLLGRGQEGGQGVAAGCTACLLPARPRTGRRARPPWSSRGAHAAGPLPLKAAAAHLASRSRCSRQSATRPAATRAVV
jgi:hypothetical protein